MLDWLNGRDTQRRIADLETELKHVEGELAGARRENAALKQRIIAATPNERFAEVLARNIQLTNELAQTTTALAERDEELALARQTISAKRPTTLGEDAIVRLEERVAELTGELNAVAAERDRARAAGPGDLNDDERAELLRLRRTVRVQDQRLLELTERSMIRDRYKQCGFEGVHT